MNGGSLEPKISRIRDMFTGLVPEYDRFNRWSSLGLDEVWRREALSMVRPAQRVLDLGCGTGALGRHLTVDSEPSARLLVGVDLSPEMLRRARENLEKCRTPVLWSQASGSHLPFRSQTFDAVVSAFVLRNLIKADVLSESLREIFRVLRKDGRVLFLDLATPPFFVLRWGHRLYTRSVVPLMGRVLFGSRWPGGYLASSIQQLPSPEILRQKFESTGFRGFQTRFLTGGVASFFTGFKKC